MNAKQRARKYQIENPTASIRRVVDATGVAHGTVAAARRELVAEGLRAPARNSPPVTTVVEDEPAREGADHDVDIASMLEDRLARAFKAAAVPDAAIPELVASVGALAEQLAVEVCRE